MGAGPEVVDHAGQARGEDVHAVHEPERAFSRKEVVAAPVDTARRRGSGGASSLR